jgi:PII-like signaling protein
METVIRKRIEILVDTPLVRLVTDAVDAAGITGWSVFPVTAGKGRDGPWREDRVTGAEKTLVVTVASQEKSDRLAEALAPMLTTHGLLLTMWDVEVIRGERF